MENTSPKKLRAKLKDYLDLAQKEIVRIKRRSGQNYILISEEKYNELKLELMTLQKRLLGKSVDIAEKITEKVKDKKKSKKKDKVKNKNKKRKKSTDKKKIKASEKKNKKAPIKKKKSKI